ncbi:MAG: cysteine desulfurase [Bacteroidetes bacterium]|nr:cysteine desulfurase [Bacteroidota bacterium]
MSTHLHSPSLRLEKVRGDFPALHQSVNGRPLVYLDNAATAQKPEAVIEAVSSYYRTDNSNVHRGVHTLSQRATDAFEAARANIARYIGASSPKEVIFTRGTTEAINLVAFCFGGTRFKKGDEVIVSEMEHHSNIVPWQMACERSGAVLRVIPVTDSGELQMEAFRALLSERTKLVAVTHISNSLGTINPVEEIISAAHEHGVPVLLDGAQALPHCSIDVTALDVDFYCFSSHKMFGPTGFGVLFGKEHWLEQLPPYQGGGDMIKVVDFAGTTYNDLPHKFEAGTPHIAGAIGLSAAMDYVSGVGFEFIANQEKDLLLYATGRLKAIDGLVIVGNAKHKAAVVSFNLGSAHPYDVGTILDKFGIGVRTGHHCTQPLMKRLGIPGTVRASFSFYNSRAEIDQLELAVRKAAAMLL